MNPINIIKGFLQKGLNPEQMISNIISQKSNPMMQNLMKMAKNGN